MISRDASAILDEYLVLQCQGGSTGAFKLLVRRWNSRLLGHAFQYTRDTETARDVVQEAWMAIVRGLGSLHDPARFRAWAYRIVANKARDWIRRETVRRRAAEQAATQAEEASTPTAGSSGALARVRAGLQALDAEPRLILTWFYLEEMSVREIAEALSIPVGTVKSRLFHARNALKGILEEEA